MHIVRDDGDLLVELDIYQLTVPFGAISDNQRFWKHVDEDHVDLTTHDLLLKNGVRVGIGPNDEWGYFKGLIDHYGATTRKGATTPSRKAALELPIRSGIERQDIFYLNDRGVLYGRSYEACDNILSLNFEPTPRHPGDVRINACAVIRGLHRRFEVTVLNDVRQIEERFPEYLYDLRLAQNVPLDHFLVIAPSNLAGLPDNLGHRFFVNDGAAEPTETVMIFVPRTFHLGARATPFSPTAANLGKPK